MIPLFVDRIVRPQPNGAGYEHLEQHYREVLAAGREVAIASGKRAEFAVAPGIQAVVYVIEGSVRFEGDDTQAGAGDIVWFRAASEAALLGVEADAPFRGALMMGNPPSPG